ncbi:MMPL family transporter [Mycobacterium sp. 852002-40037_SCH5390672]|uniref:MMPL family transporter n=1 Tax=Mycobacterium sp. 852002-40037_SCH5390672 TaxID=1834089 RepID=UPI0009EDB5E9|nr:MMPL family transporter [Mycobacterium sp. 852002-40037_SCH5390672]
MLHRMTLMILAAPRRVIAIAALVFVGAAVFGIPAAKNLSPGGFQDPTSESSRAAQLLADKFGQSDEQLVITVSAPEGAGSAKARSVGSDLANRLRQSPWVFNVSSAWTSPPQVAAKMVSTDGKAGLVVADLKGGESTAQQYAKTLVDQLVRDRDGVTVRAGGIPVVYGQVTAQNERDLVLMESLAIPLNSVVLAWVFGGVIATMLPMAVGLMAIVGALSVLRLVALSNEVSVFGLNLCSALGLALAIDYTLLIISRYRDELADGAAPDEALIHTMVTAGRTVLFSATTVALAMAVMVLFPMYFLKSFAYAGVATVSFVAVAAIVVTPAAIVLLGPRLDALDLRRLGRRILRRPFPVPKQVEQLCWYRWTKLVMRHAVPIGLTVVSFLVLLGVPFLGVKWGFPDDRVLPNTSSARQVGDQLRGDFAYDPATALSVVIPDASGLSPADLERYAADLSRVPSVSAVTAPSGTFVEGTRAGPPAAPSGLAQGSAFLTVASTAPLFSPTSDIQLDRLHAVHLGTPPDRNVEIGGLAQINRDSVHAITARLPLVLGLIATIMFVLLFLLTGSVVLPVKALVLNVFSLTATFGALVWIFQDGHLGALGTTPTGTLIVSVPVLLFCIAFGLSMDYEVFLMSRIREYRIAIRASHEREDCNVNDESVALGLARTGRVITAAALVMCIPFAALIAAQVSVMRMFGMGLTLAVLVDATLVRMVLVPAFMRILGRVNWWAPKSLIRLHERFGMTESSVNSMDVTATAAESGRSSR